MPCHRPCQRGDVACLVVPVSCTTGTCTSAIARQVAWHEITLQSCLCSTPDLRSFHMGLALFTLTALQNPLRGLKRLLVHPAHTDAAVDADATVLGRPRPPIPQQGPRPLRGNWPFTVKPPLRPSEAPARQPAPAGRSFLPMAPMGSDRHAFLSTRTTDSHVRSLRPTKVLRRVSDSGTGRLVIAGRMADVCAELDRMVASEAMRA